MTDEPFLSAGDLATHNLLAWQEAVAVVQAVCDRLSDGGNVPELDQIGLLSTGDVVLRQAATSTEPPVRRLGLTLIALLRDSHTPASLRLFASQVTASTPLYSSLEDFSRGLAYFERPDRSRMLQAAYERAVPALAQAMAAARRSEQRDAPSGGKAAREPQGTKTQQRRLIFGVIAVVAFCAASFAVWRRVDISTVKSNLLNRTKTSAAAIVHAGVSSGLDLLRTVGLASASRTVPKPETTTQNKIPPGRRARPAQTKSGAGVESSGSVPAAASSPTDNNLSANGSATAPTNTDATSTRQEGAVTDHPLVDSRIYTADDKEVSLPTLFSPQLPALPLDAANASSGVNGVVVDLLINERGTVDAVKFLTPPTDLQQRMLISALKAWRYHPALKEGQPVRFLHRVRLTS